ncbi:hypothetical protein GCM10023339_28210 [Alloalcanivorax gelatiniphagus]
MSAHRLTPSPHVSPSERLQLVLAACCALSLTPVGLTMAAVVLVVMLARRQARRWVERSAAVRRGVLAPAQQPGLLHPTGHRRQAVAGP